MRIASMSSLALLVLSLTVVGCGVTPMSAIAAHREGYGTTKIYDATFDQAWQAAHIALAWDGAGTPEDHPERQFVITNHPASEGPSFNDQVGVWFRPLGPYKTRVSVVVMTAPEPADSIIGPDESSLQKDIAKALALVKSGAPVETAPSEEE
jgi:hypothetical protein